MKSSYPDPWNITSLRQAREIIIEQQQTIEDAVSEIDQLRARIKTLEPAQPVATARVIGRPPPPAAATAEKGLAKVIVFNDWYNQKYPF